MKTYEEGAFVSSLFTVCHTKMAGARGVQVAVAVMSTIAWGLVRWLGNTTFCRAKFACKTEKGLAWGVAGARVPAPPSWIAWLRALVSAFAPAILHQKYPCSTAAATGRSQAAAKQGNPAKWRTSSLHEITQKQGSFVAHFSLFERPVIPAFRMTAASVATEMSSGR